MSPRRSTGRRAAAALALLGCSCLAAAAPALAQGPEWHLEQPLPPSPSAGGGCSGEAASCTTPIGLGRIGDIEFSASDSGLLITAGNGSTIRPGVWFYNGAQWHELAEVCGASDGRIAWAGAEEFWTVADGRAGQAANAQGVLPPLEDDTLCHFLYNPATARLEVARSYAAPAFSAASYQPMQAAACLSPTDCWFAGAPLPAPQPGAFQLHWNGESLEAQPNAAIHSVRASVPFEGKLLESVGLAREEPVGSAEEPEEILHPFVLVDVPAEAGEPFEGLRPFSSTEEALPEYASGSFPQALSGLVLAADQDAEGQESLWAGAGPAASPPNGSAPGELTLLHDAGGTWTQVLGPPGPQTLNADPAQLSELEISSIAGEPGTDSAWLALDSAHDLQDPLPNELARIVHVQADGTITEQQLPSPSELAAGVGAKGAAARIACPAANDCWLATTQGWLFHLSEAGAATGPTDGDPAFNGPLVTFRPPDEGIPQSPSAALPVDDSGEEGPPRPSLEAAPANNIQVSEQVALVSDVRSRLVGRTVLELRFHLATSARVRLLALRRTAVVARTSMRTLKRGTHSLSLRLNPHRWPTRITLQTHALGTLPTVTVGSGVDTIVTSMRGALRSLLGGLATTTAGSRP